MYRGRGGGGVGAFCHGTTLPDAAAAMMAVEGRGLLIVRGVSSSSSSEEDSTLRRAGRDVVDCAAITIGEKLPGALDCGVPVDCDMVVGL
jgi:hypothetical protein